ncbi:Uncharacterized RNA-binding protein C22E12.02 [Seminavis robusta]|uniref:Uncharacterized RNA-binding protein C22E12.02 n=1 Tax=Seminavis robusta TaxID=568900 RepID=A0A9N8DLG1_9STRA|nr:Uncharacterized RNA-binding protein C22E12.02 [Seminavis robusta]|eukprot:Sro196_g083660.1 Uncharacterized RNA-binding protein C22E12.02 (279) ;mRNA; f:83086-83922
MADDDLDDFFAEVSDAEAKVTEETPGIDESTEQKQGDEETTTKESSEPPTKKQKTSAPVRPRGVVVAASTSVVIPAKKREELVAEMESAAARQQQNEATSHATLTVAAGPIRGPTPAAASIGPAFPAGPSNVNTNSNASSNANETKVKASVRMAAGQAWVDKSLDEWPQNDFRIFVGNLSNEVDDQGLFQHFSKYPSLAKAKVVRHNNNPEKSKGYGFVSLLDPLECARAIREMDQTWLCSRPIRVKRSDWKERDFKVVKKREKKEKKQQKRKGNSII